MNNILRNGDIIGLAPKGLEKLFTGLIEPYAGTHHHVLLGSYIPDEEDWVIYESLYSGVRVGRLQWYKDQRIRVYRYNEEIGQKALERASWFGRRGYDYVLPAQLFMSAVWFWLRHGFKPVSFWNLRDRPNKQLLCTELCTQSYKPFVNIVPEIIAATPSAIYRAGMIGVLAIVYEGRLSDLFAVHGLMYRKLK